MTTDPLAKKLAELKACQTAILSALDQLNKSFRDGGCVTSELIDRLEAAHIRQRDVMGLK